MRKHTYSRPDTLLTDIRDIIADLATKQLQLSRLIEAKLAEPNTDLDAVGCLFGLHGQNASRLGCLLRDRRTVPQPSKAWLRWESRTALGALDGDAADGIAGAIAQALDELSTELGTDL